MKRPSSRRLRSSQIDNVSRAGSDRHLAGQNSMSSRGKALVAQSFSRARLFGLHSLRSDAGQPPLNLLTSAKRMQRHGPLAPRSLRVQVERRNASGARGCRGVGYRKSVHLSRELLSFIAPLPFIPSPRAVLCCASRWIGSTGRGDRSRCIVFADLNKSRPLRVAPGCMGTR